jgi:hypothetical protein
MKILAASLLVLGTALTAMPANAQECLQSSRELQKIMNPEGHLGAMKDAMGEGAPEEIRRAISQAADEIIGPIVPKLEETAAQSMTKHFTCAEIEGMKAFYQTPVGRAMIAKMPAFYNDMMEQNQREVAALMPKFQKRMQELMANTQR